MTQELDEKIKANKEVIDDHIKDVLQDDDFKGAVLIVEDKDGNVYLSGKEISSNMKLAMLRKLSSEVGEAVSDA